MIYIDSGRCTGCGACVETCPTGAIQLTRGETGSHAEIDEELCKECEACVEVCPEEAIMSGVGPAIEGELVEVKAAPVPVESQPREVRLVRPAPKALAWLGAALVFAGREIVPRLAASLLDAWDRRAGRLAPSPGDWTSGRSAQQPMADLSPSGRRRHRRRRGRG